MSRKQKTGVVFAASRLSKLPPYLFKQLDELKRNYRGRRLLDFGEGNPDLPPEKEIIQHFIQALRKGENHRYPNYEGLIITRLQVARWYKKRFGVELDPEKEVCMLIGSKEGIAHLFWAICGPGDTVAVGDPSFPIYRNCPLLAGAKIKILPLVEENNFLPELGELKGKRIKLLALNYPNNPTGACAPKEFYREVVDLAHKEGFLVFNDNVYSEIYFASPPPSLLEVPGAKEVAVEFHSLSKTFNMAGWRLGFVVGNRDIISALLRIKQNVDTGPWNCVQEAGVYALTYAERIAKKIREIYSHRQEIFFSGVKELNWEIRRPQATFYVWAKTPNGEDSLSFCSRLLKNAGVLCAPGVGFGRYGAGYLRFSLTVPERDIKDGLVRLNKFLSKV